MGIVFFQDKDDEHRVVRDITKWIVDIVVVLTLALYLVEFMGIRHTVSGHSMEPVLFGGDMVLIDRLSYRLGHPKRLDVVLFQKKDGDEKQYLKRIIGLPGETVQIKEGIVYINDSPAKLPEGLEEANLAGLAQSPVILGDEEYFLLGDNRDSSEDSRFENVGNVSRNQIVGKAWFKLLPLERIGFMD